MANRTGCSAPLRPKWCHFKNKAIQPCCFHCGLSEKCVKMYHLLKEKGCVPCSVNELARGSEQDCEYFVPYDLPAKKD